MDTPYTLFFQENRFKRYEAAFSLVELMIVISIIALTLVFIIPSFTTLVMDMRLTTQANNFMNALSYARSTALSQDISVQVCPFGAASSSACGSSWSSGWIVITQPKTGTATLLQSNAIRANTVVLSGTGVTNVTFTSRGIVATQANFKFCDTRGGNYAQSLEVLPTGLVQIGSTAGKAVWDGGALTCP